MQTDVPTPKPDDTEELVHQDDRVIGRAFRWSAVAVVLIGIAAALSVFLATRKARPLAAKLTKIEAPVAPQRAIAQVPAVRFTDITKEAGIDFVHNTGAYCEKLIPETMGSGV